MTTKMTYEECKLLATIITKTFQNCYHVTMTWKCRDQMGDFMYDFIQGCHTYDTANICRELRTFIITRNMDSNPTYRILKKRIIKSFAN